MKGVLSEGFVKVAYELNRKDLTMEDSVIKEESHVCSQNMKLSFANDY